MTFEAWSGLVEEKKEQQRMARKALSFFLNKGLAMCYHAWQGWARQERQRKIDEGKARASASVQDNYDRLEKIEPQLKEYEEALQAETEQRHYEAEQVKNVLQHLEKLLGDSFAGIQDNMAARREHMKQSGARAAIYRIKRNKIGAAFEAWQQGADAQKVEKMEEEAAKAKAKEEEKAKAKAKARREHIMAKIVYKMEGNRKGSAFTAWKGQWVRAKEGGEGRGGGAGQVGRGTGQVAEHPGAIAESARPRPEVRPVLHAPLRLFASADGLFALRQIYAASEDLPANPGQGRAGDRLPEQRHAGQVTASNL